MNSSSFPCSSPIFPENPKAGAEKQKTWGRGRPRQRDPGTLTASTPREQRAYSSASNTGVSLSLLESHSLTAPFHPMCFHFSNQKLDAPRAGARSKHLGKSLDHWSNTKGNPKGGFCGFLLQSPAAFHCCHLTSHRTPISPSPNTKKSPNPVQIDYFIDNLHTEVFRKGRGLRSQLPGPPTLVLHFVQSQSAGPDA